MSCWVFQLGQSPLIFLLWDTLSVWDSHVEDSIWSRRTGKSPLPELGGYISSAVAAGRWQLGPSSRYQRAKWSLELCCRWTPWSGLLGNLGSSQRHLVDFTQIVESWRRCWLFGAWDFWLWQLPGFCRTYPILAGVSLSPQSPSGQSHRDKLVCFSVHPFIYPGHSARMWQPGWLSHKACLCREILRGWSSCGVWARYSHGRWVGQGWWKYIRSLARLTREQRVDQRKVVCWSKCKFEPITFFSSFFCVLIFLLSFSSLVCFNFYIFFIFLNGTTH